MALTMATSWARSSSKRGDTGLSGLATAASAPASVARSDRAMSSGRTLDDTTTMGVGARTMISRVASSPSTRGMCTSMVTRSGRRRIVISTASEPSAASPTTRMAGSLSRMATRSARCARESSATTTRIIVLLSPPAGG
jgi:hypothetical protein